MIFFNNLKIHFLYFFNKAQDFQQPNLELYYFLNSLLAQTTLWLYDSNLRKRKTSASVGCAWCVGSAPKVLPMFAVIAECLWKGWDGWGVWGSPWITQIRVVVVFGLWISNLLSPEALGSFCFTSLSCVSLGYRCLCCSPALAAQAHSGQEIQARSQKSAVPKQLWIPCEYFVVMTVAPHTTPLRSMTRSC